MIPPAIKPYSIRVVIFNQLSKLVIHKIIIAFPIRFIRVLSGTTSCSSHRIIVTGPIYMRVIKMHFQPLTAAFINKFTKHVTMKWSSFNYIIISELRVKHRKTIVVTGSEANIFCPGILKSTNPLFCIKIGRIKTTCRLGILLFINITILHIPLALCKSTIYAPVQENSKFMAGKLFSSFKILGSRLITGCHNRLTE